MYNIGIMGFGTVGKAIAYGFKDHANIRIYDKYNNVYDTLFNTVSSSDFIFICVPTPNNEDGTQDISHVDDAVHSVISIAIEGKVIIICSTILPGTTRKYMSKYRGKGHSIAFCPEFITEKNAIQDFKETKRVIVGISSFYTEKVRRLFKTALPNAEIYITDTQTAELVKYLDNCYFAVKLSFLNEMYDIAESLGIAYSEVQRLWLAGDYIEYNHTDVPGADGWRGFGGKCLPKDLKAFIHWARDPSHGDTYQLNMCEAADEVNERVRKPRGK